MEEDATHIPLLGPSLLAGWVSLHPQCCAWHHPCPPSKPTSTPGAWRCQQWHPVAVPQAPGHPVWHVQGYRHVLTPGCRYSLLCPPSLLLWEVALEEGSFLSMKMVVEAWARDSRKSDMHAASFSSAVLGFWKCLVVVGSFPFLYLPSFWARKSCWLEGCRCAGICC